MLSQNEISALALSLLSKADRDAVHVYQTYTLEWLPVAANAQRAPTTTPTQITSDGDFIACTTNLLVTDTAATPAYVTNPLFLLSIRVADRELFDRDTPIQNVAMTDGLQHPLTWPIRMTRASLITGRLTNLTPGTAFNVRLTIEGFLILDNVPRGVRAF